MPFDSREIHRRDFLRALGGAALLTGGAALAGCGGGSGGDTPPPGGGSVTPQQRWAALDAASAKRQEIAAAVSGAAAQNEALAAYLRTQSAFEAVGVDDTLTVWARTRDGQMVLFPNNRPPEGDGRITDPPLTGGRAVPQVPRPQQAYLVHAFGLGFGVGQSVVTDLGNWLKDKGYVLEISAEGNADARRLALVGGDGVFYFNTHAGAAKDRQGVRHYCLWTSTVCTLLKDQDPWIQEELAAGRLVRMNCDTGEMRNGKPVMEYHYSITSRFVDAYWDFEGSCLVWLNACFSMKDNPEIQAFRDACVRKGAAAVVGWTSLMTPNHGYRATRFVFDRLLGANASEPENPNQRPFDLGPVMAEVVRRGLQKDPATGAELAVFPTAGTTLLTPTIKFLDVDAFEDELILHGEFGPDQRPNAAVTIAGMETAIKTWNPQEIRCVLPRTAPGNAGDVQVTVRGRKSNLRRLTEWRGQFRYRLDDAGTLEIGITLNCHFRADVQDYRDLPGEAPKKRPVYFTGALDSAGAYLVKGEASDDDTQYIWSGQGNLPHLEKDQDPAGRQFMFLSGVVDTTARVMRLGITGGNLKTDAWRTRVYSDGELQHDFTNAVAPDPRAYNKTGALPPGTPARPLLEVPINTGYAITAGSHQKTVDSFANTLEGDPVAIVRWEWDTIAPVAPPDPGGTRSR